MFPRIVKDRERLRAQGKKGGGEKGFWKHSKMAERWRGVHGPVRGETAGPGAQREL